MNIGARDDVLSKALKAVHEAERAGLDPMRWTLGRDTYRQLLRDVTPSADFTTLVGLPFEVKNDAPPSLLELDAF
jgi:hypothetical protein